MIQLTVAELEQRAKDLSTLVHSDHLPGVAIRHVFQWRKAIMDAWEEPSQTRSVLVQRYGEDGQITPDMPGWEPFVSEWREVAVDTVEIDLEPIHYADLADDPDARDWPGALLGLMEAGIVQTEEDDGG